MKLVSYSNLFIYMLHLEKTILINKSPINKRNLNISYSSKTKTGLVNSSPYFTVPVVPTKVVCKLRPYDISDMSDFIKALSSTRNLNLTSSYAEGTLASLIMLHPLIYIVHNSNFVDYIYKYRRHLTIPCFLHPYLTKVAMEVDSRSDNLGWVKGSLINDKPLSKPFEIIGNLNEDYLKELFIKTGLSRFSRNHESSNILSNIRLRTTLLVEYYESGDTDKFYEEVIAQLSQMDSMFYSTSHKTGISFEGYIEHSKCDHLNIYRFRNSRRSDSYNVSNSSCVTTNEALLNVYACFLKIFSPKFYDDKGTLLPSNKLPGDVVMDLSADRFDYWRFYLSGATYEVKSNTKPKSPTDSSRDTIVTGSKRRYSTSQSVAPHFTGQSSNATHYLILHESGDGVIYNAYTYPKHGSSLLKFRDYNCYPLSLSG